MTDSDKFPRRFIFPRHTGTLAAGVYLHHRLAYHVSISWGKNKKRKMK